MANEKFLTYDSISDPNSRVTETDSRVTWASMTRDETAYYADDKGVDFFDGDFIHLLTINTTNINYTDILLGVHWAVSNTLGSWQGVRDASGDELYLSVAEGSGGVAIQLTEIDGGSITTNSAAYVVGTILYLKIVRDESVGTYGTLYCYIYSDSARTTLVDTLTVTLHTSKKDFRYIYAFQSYGVPTNTGDISGYTEDLSLSGEEASVLPEVTQQAPDVTGATTATGNGDISSVGLSPVTAHGHCWKTEAAYLADGLLPLTSDSNVDNGAVAALGAFTSAVTGLTAGIRYIMRAYATNTQGTAYSDIAYIWYSGDSAILEAGNYAVKTTKWHYVGTDGVEYYVQGIPVT